MRHVYGQTSLRFDLMFFGHGPGGGLPGALLGNDPANGYGSVTVEADKVEAAVAHLRKYGYLVRDRRPSRDPGGDPRACVRLRIRLSKAKQRVAICFGCKGPIVGHQAWVRVDSRTFAHAGCVEGAH